MGTAELPVDDPEPAADARTSDEAKSSLEPAEELKPEEANPTEEEDKVVVFEPGKIALRGEWGSGTVTIVHPGGQAERAGVKKGWRILTLNDAPYSEAELDALIARNEGFRATFKIQEARATEEEAAVAEA